MDLVGRWHAAVLDAMAVILAVDIGERLGHGVEHDLDRRVTLGVRAGLQAEAVCAADQAPQLGGLVVELAVVAGVKAVAALEVGGEARQRAVGVELQPGEGEVVVAEA